MDDAQLLVSELATNAIRHAAPAQTVRVSLARDDEQLYLDVHDSSPMLPAARPPDEDNEGGRGLYLVSCLAKEWGAETTGAGKRTWAVLPLP